MKKALIFLFSLLYVSRIYAGEQDTLPGNWLLASRFQYGFIIAHRPTVNHLQEKHTKGLEMEFILPLNGKEDWQQPLLIPSYGFAYQYINSGTDFLKGVHVATARILFPLNKGKKITTSLTAGTGIGYVENKYDRIENYKNVAIGSHINAAVSFSFRATLPTGKYSRVETGLSFTHLSNGSVKPPNLGINIPALQIGYSRYFGRELVREFREVPAVSKKPFYKIFLGGGIKGVDLAKGLNMYGVTGLSLARNFIISHKSTFAAGLDFLYDRSLNRKLENLKKEKVAAGTACRAGLMAGYGFTAGRFLMMFQNGIYILDNYKEDGILYTRVGVDYRFSKSLVAGFHLKSHFAKADYFEYGIGYIF